MKGLPSSLWTHHASNLHLAYPQNKTMIPLPEGLPPKGTKLRLIQANFWKCGWGVGTLITVDGVYDDGGYFRCRKERGFFSKGPTYHNFGRNWKEGFEVVSLPLPEEDSRCEEKHAGEEQCTLKIGHEGCHVFQLSEPPEEDAKTEGESPFADRGPDSCCDICASPFKAPPEFPNDTVCCCKGVQTYALSCYPGEYKLVRSHPSNGGSLWYRREDIDPVLDCLAESRAEVERLKRSIAAERSEIDRWIEREATVCPEDVGFEEYITALREENKRLREAISDAVENANGNFQCDDGERAHLVHSDHFEPLKKSLIPAAPGDKGEGV